MVDKSLINEITQIIGEESIRIHEPMIGHTSFQVGGPVDIMVLPKSREMIIKLMEFLRHKGLPYFVMGNGTNLIVRDKGIRGFVIKISNNFCDIKMKNDNTIIAQAGARLKDIALKAMKEGLTGFEFASGIPGTLGGAVVMNAGAYDGEIKDVVQKTLYLDSEGKVVELYGDEHCFGYRSSIIQKNNGIVLEAEICLQKGNRMAIEKRMKELDKRREDKQPLDLPSAGSIFRRPEGFFTGRLIEECGLRGYKIGGAMVSEKHCGFIVNYNNASAEDITGLIEYIKDTVYKGQGVVLETEVKVVGEI